LSGVIAMVANDDDALT